MPAAVSRSAIAIPLALPLRGREQLAMVTPPTPLLYPTVHLARTQSAPRNAVFKHYYVTPPVCDLCLQLFRALLLIVFFSELLVLQQHHMVWLCVIMDHFVCCD